MSELYAGAVIVLMCIKRSSVEASHPPICAAGGGKSIGNEEKNF